MDEKKKIDFDLIARIACQHFKSLPKKGKPLDSEWTTFASIIKSTQDKNVNNKYYYEVVTCSTGTKCLGEKELSNLGDMVVDSHAESLCRRSFLLYLITQIENCRLSKTSIFKLETTHVSEELTDTERDKYFNGEGLMLPLNPQFSLRDDINFHLFISQLPCGDASIIQSENVETLLTSTPNKINEDSVECEPQPKKSKMSESNRTGAKLKCGPLVYEEIQSVGNCRVKPGKGDPTLCMSCSDKMAKWQILGLQGSLLGNIIQSPIRLSSVIIGSGTPYSMNSLERAIWTRFESKLANLKSSQDKQFQKMMLGYIKPEFYNASVNFMTLTNPPDSDSIKSPSPSSIIWHLNNYRAPHDCLQVVVNGRKQGTTKKNIGKGVSMVDICRQKILASFVKLYSKLVSKNNLSTMSYLEVKKLNKNYVNCWNILRGEVMVGWTKKPEGLQDFCLQVLDDI